jgi:hypothetical protein
MEQGRLLLAKHRRGQRWARFLPGPKNADLHPLPWGVGSAHSIAVEEV